MSAHRTSEAEGDQLFIHYGPKQRLIAWISRTFFDNITYTVRHGKLAGLKRRGGLGWLPGFVSDSNPNAEETFWRNIDLQGRVAYDIGAFHGLLTMLFSQRAKTVVAYEPNAKNRARLEANLSLNGIKNVKVRGVALGAEAGTAQMLWDAAAPGGARVVHVDGGGDSIEIGTLDSEVAAGLPAPDFVKIDVEGFEGPVLVGGRDTFTRLHPELFIEIHGNSMNEKKRNVAGVVKLLRSFGYERIVHLETGTIIDETNSDVAARGHLHCPRKAG
jgi:FkbM family methyltransferase